MTTNQRHEALFTTTPIADLAQPLNHSPIYFPQFVDGGGYVTQFILISGGQASDNTLQFRDENGAPFVW
jgi:hypothetical protein